MRGKKNRPYLIETVVERLEKALQECLDLPVVVLTTRTGAKHINLARRLGIAHYVTKPVEEGAFVRLIVSLTARGAGLEPTETRS